MVVRLQAQLTKKFVQTIISLRSAPLYNTKLKQEAESKSFYHSSCIDQLFALRQTSLSHRLFKVKTTSSFQNLQDL